MLEGELSGEMGGKQIDVGAGDPVTYGLAALVLFAVIWFLVLFVVLPLRLETQGDRGEKVPGTQAGVI